MENFLALGLPQPLLLSLQKMQFSKPTPIQAAAVPLALAGKDILGSAQTGTGKTAAFAIPLLTRLLTRKQGTALILTPTRELATQIMREMQKMLVDSPQIKAAVLIGGESMFRQLQQLRQHPRLVIGTPGRINDHLQQGSLKLHNADFLVLDEADKMLDMGFEAQIERVIKHLPRERQTLLFSATLPAHIIRLSEKYLKSPQRVSVGSTHTPIAKISQELIRLPVAEKYSTLLNQLSQRTGSVIVFVRTKHGADKLAKKINGEKQTAQAIHGNLNQNQRTRVIDGFRNKNFRILVATDVAARGLDIPHIEHVINYDLPQCPEDYIHRIGRTARAGAEGAAVCFITPEDHAKWREIHILMNPEEKTASSKENPARKIHGGDASNRYARKQSERRRFSRKKRHRDAKQRQYA